MITAAATKSGRYRDRLRIERSVPDDSFDGAGSAEWALVVELYAEVQDTLPSRAERLSDGINLATRPARVRMRWRTDITPAMRFVLGATVNGSTIDYTGARIMQVVSGPAHKRDTDEAEFMVEDYSTAGGGA